MREFVAGHVARLSRQSSTKPSADIGLRSEGAVVIQESRTPRATLVRNIWSADANPCRDVGRCSFAGRVQPAMTKSDWVVIVKKIAVGLALTVIPVTLIVSSLVLARALLERSTK